MILYSQLDSQNQFEDFTLEFWDSLFWKTIITTYQNFT